MEFLELAKKRYSTRKYLDKKVEDEKLEKILKAAHVAPTGANKQPFKLIVVREKAGLEKIGKAGKIYGAPLAVIVCADTGAAWVNPFSGKNISDIDAAIVTDHMMLAATDLGLGSLWVCWFNPAVLSEEFNIPANYEPLNILVIGYAADEAASPERHSSKRKPLEALVSYETM